MKRHIDKDEHGWWGVDETGVARCFEDVTQAARYLDLLQTDPSEADRDDAQAKARDAKIGTERDGRLTGG